MCRGKRAGDICWICFCFGRCQVLCKIMGVVSFFSAGVGFLHMHGLDMRYCLFGLEEVTVLLVGSSWRARYMVSFTRVED